MPELIHYMMATKAMRGFVDISRHESSLCLVEGEVGGNYVGWWVEGAALFKVRFPKATTRELTQEEVEMYDNDMGVSIGGVRMFLFIRRTNAAWKAAQR